MKPVVISFLYSANHPTFNAIKKKKKRLSKCYVILHCTQSVRNPMQSVSSPTSYKLVTSKTVDNIRQCERVHPLKSTRNLSFHPGTYPLGDRELAPYSEACHCLPILIASMFLLFFLINKNSKNLYHF